jgi:C4-dicarboxylate-specific signal transduction histidine kinase
VVNARDAKAGDGLIATSTGNVALREGEVWQLPAGQCIRTSVRDSDSGLLPEVMASAFEPFFTTKNDGKGTWLGLSQAPG